MAFLFAAKACTNAWVCNGQTPVNLVDKFNHTGVAVMLRPSDQPCMVRRPRQPAVGLWQVAKERIASQALRLDLNLVLLHGEGIGPLRRGTAPYFSEYDLGNFHYRCYRHFTEPLSDVSHVPSGGPSLMLFRGHHEIACRVLVQ